MISADITCSVLVSANFFSRTYTSDIFRYDYHAFPLAGREGSGLMTSSLEHCIFAQSQEIQQPFHSRMSQISPKQDNYLHKPYSSKLNNSIPIRLCIVDSILSAHLFPITTYPTLGVVGRLELISSQRWATPRTSRQFITGLPYRDKQAVTPTGNLERLVYVTSMSQGEHAKCEEKVPESNPEPPYCPWYISISSALKDPTSVRFYMNYCFDELLLFSF